MSGAYLIDTLVNVMFLVCLAASLNVLMGHAGQFSMATAAFYGVGAYTLAFMSGKGLTLLSTEQLGPGWPFVPSLIVAILFTAFLGVVVSLPAARRIKGEYVILLTLAFQYLVSTSAQSLVKITGGPMGLPVRPISAAGHAVSTPLQGGISVLIATVVILAVGWLLGKWGFGRLLRGVREDEEALRSLGKSTTIPKTVAFGVSAGMAGAIGGVSAAYLLFVAPSTYSLDLAILASAAVALGGAGNMVGVTIAAIVLASINPILTNLGMSSINTVPWQYVIFGVLLILGIRFRPQGLLPERRGRYLPRLRASTHMESLPPKIGEEDAPEALPVTTEQPAAPALPADRPESVPLVRVSGLSKRFGGIAAVTDVSFELHPGEIVALIGPNGAGKTTIFNLLTNAIPPDKGVVELRGQELRRSSPQDIVREGMVRSWQHVRVFPNMSVLDNVAVAIPNQLSEHLWALVVRPRAAMKREREVKQLAYQNLEFVGMHEFADSKVGDLSFGQQKSVAIARVLATGCDVLLLDEPTSGVDPKSAEEAIQLVKRVASTGKSVCIVEHSLHVVEALADRVIFLDGGRVIAQGSVESVTSQPELADLYFGRRYEPAKET